MLPFFTQGRMTCGRFASYNIGGWGAENPVHRYYNISTEKSEHVVHLNPQHAHYEVKRSRFLPIATERGEICVKISLLI